jgi:hypothetical protein
LTNAGMMGLEFREYLGLPERTVRILSSFLQDRTLQVTESGLSSRVVNLRAGTPQGSCLPPLIYIISVNNMPTRSHRGVGQSKYADDTGIFAMESSELGAVRKVQRAVDDIERWCRKWRVKLNGDKSQLIIISRKKKKPDENLCILLFDDVVRPVQKAKFLGVEIDETLSLKGHIQDIAARAEKRINILKALALGGTGPKDLIKLYMIYSRPSLEYGSIAFALVPKTTMEILQKVQNKAIRIALGLPRYISIELLHKSACLPRIGKRLLSMSTKLLAKMKASNELIRELVDRHQEES